MDINEVIAKLGDLSVAELMQLEEGVQAQLDVHLPNIVIARTGYVSRLCRPEFPPEGEEGEPEFEFLEACSEIDVKPLFLVDSLWGDGVYFDLNTECAPGYIVAKVDKDRKEMSDQLPRKIRKLFEDFGKYGTVAFEAPRGWNPTEFLRELDYCCIWNGPETVTSYIKPYGRVTVFDDYGTESG